MIYYISTRQHDYTFRYAAAQIGRQRVRILHYHRLFRMKNLPVATYIFTDIERLDPWERDAAADIYRHIVRSQTGARALNDPARVKWRHEFLRAAFDAGINGFNAYRPDEIGPSVRFPVFVRVETHHDNPLTDLIHSQAELEETLARLSAEGHSSRSLVIIEYAAEPLASGLFRKIAAYRVGPAHLAYHFLHEEQWLVKHGMGNSGAISDESRREEAAYIRSNPHEDILRRAFDLACIDYGRADFGLVGGRPQIYEINTNPHIKDMNVVTSPIKRETMEFVQSNLFSAIEMLDASGQTGERIRLDSDRLKALQRFPNWLYALRPRQ